MTTKMTRAMRMELANSIRARHAAAAFGSRSWRYHRLKDRRHSDIRSDMSSWVTFLVRHSVTKLREATRG
jgi:hypothetical protein